MKIIKKKIALLLLSSLLTCPLYSMEREESVELVSDIKKHILSFYREKTFLDDYETIKKAAIGFIQVSPDGKKFLMMEDTIVFLWDLDSKRLKVFKGHILNVCEAIFNADGKTILTASKDNTVRLWDIKTEKELQLFRHSKAIKSVALSPDGKTVLTGLGDGTVFLFDVETGNALKELKGHTNYITSLAFSPDSKTALTGSQDRTAILWDVATGIEIKKFIGHTWPICSVAFSPDGKTVLTGSYDTTARLWDVKTKEGYILKGHTRAVYDAIFSKDGKTILTGSEDTTVRLWDSKTGEQLRVFQEQDTLISVACGEDNKTVYTNSWNNKVRVWNSETGELVREIPKFSTTAISNDETIFLTIPQEGVCSFCKRHFTQEPLPFSKQQALHEFLFCPIRSKEQNSIPLPTATPQERVDLETSTSSITTACTTHSNISQPKESAKEATL